jgi:PII-like signaling protein
MTTGKLLRIFVNEDARWNGKPLYAAIVEELKSAGTAGATVLKGIEGFGLSRRVHSARAFDFSTNLPVLIEVFEEEAKVFEVMPRIREMMHEGLITLENVQLMRISGERA